MAERLRGKVLWLSILVRAIVFVVCAWGGLTFLPPQNLIWLVSLFLLSLILSRVSGHFFVKFYQNKSQKPSQGLKLYEG